MSHRLYAAAGSSNVYTCSSFQLGPFVVATAAGILLFILLHLYRATKFHLTLFLHCAYAQGRFWIAATSNC